MSDRFPTLQEAINTAVEQGLRNLSTMIPAKVVKWDASTQKANCQILVKQVTEGEDGEREVASWPVVPDVPVQFVGAGGFRLTCPIENGTTGSLVFAHRSMDRWLSGTGAEVDPEVDHDHALVDAVFFPGLMPFGAPWQSVSTSEMSIGSDSDGNGRIHFSSGNVKLGDGATDGVVTIADMQQLMFAIANAVPIANDGGANLQETILSALTAAGWQTGASDGQCGSSKIFAVR